MLLRFVPYVGVPLAFLFPFTLALAVDPGWSKMIWIMVLYGSVEAIIGQAIEPFLYGRSMGLSAVAVVVAAVFWTWLWGPVGLLLSTPLTMCFVVFSRHVESLKFLDVMLGDQPGAVASRKAFTCACWRKIRTRPPTRPKASCAHNSLSAYYDEVAARALMLAQADVNRGVLDPARQARIRDAIKGLIANLSERKDDEAAAQPSCPRAGATRPRTGAVRRRPRAAGRSRRVAAGGHAGQVWHRARGWCRRTRPRPPISASSTCDGVQLTCVSYLEPGTFKNARYQVRRLRKRMPGVPVMALFWGLAGDNSRYLDGIEATECDIVTTGPEGNRAAHHHLCPPGRRVRAAAMRRRSDIGCACRLRRHADHHADQRRSGEDRQAADRGKAGGLRAAYAHRKLLCLGGRRPRTRRKSCC